MIMNLAYLVVSYVLDDIEQVGAGILGVRVEFELRLGPIGASASQNSAGLSTFLVES
jgi:hypothetical protein